MFTEDELLPISALQHLVFCERQCALIHVERLWAENRLTVEGRVLHNKAHDNSHELIAGVRVARGLWLVSRVHGIVGQADIVELHSSGAVVPVEYKRGKPKRNNSDRIQLCAQAICLEEQLDTAIDCGFLFYGKRKRRTPVAIDEELRALTLGKIARLREMVENRETPTAIREPKCENCSLVELCLPDGQRFRNGVEAWNHRQYAALAVAASPSTDEFDFLG